MPQFRDRAREFLLPARVSWPSGFQRRAKQKQNLSAKERSSTELAFRFVPRSIVGDQEAVKSRDERPTGALDSLLNPNRRRVSNFVLDTADDFIDGL